MALLRRPGPYSRGPFTGPVETAPGVTGQLPTFVNAAPQLTDYLLVAGVGFFAHSLVGIQGPTQSAQYTFGTHAEATYNAEAQKQRFQPISRPATTGKPTLGEFQSVGQQFYVDIPSVVSSSVPTPPAAVTGFLGAYQSARPDLIDYQQQAKVSPSLIRGQTPPIIPVQRVDGQTDLTLQPQIWPTVRTPISAQSGKLGVYQITYPQIDTTVQPVFDLLPVSFVPTLSSVTFGWQDDPTQQQPQFWFPITQSQAVVTGSTFPALYTYGLHAETLYNAEASKQRFVKPLPSGQTPPIVPFQRVDGQVDLTPPSRFFPPVASAPTAPGVVLPYVYAAPQSVDYTLQPNVWPSRVRGQTTPIIGFQIGGPPQFDYSQQPSIQHSLPLAIINGVTVRPNAPVPPQIDANPNTTALWTYVPLSVAGTPSPPPTGLHQVNMSVTFGMGLNRMGTNT